MALSQRAIARELGYFNLTVRASRSAYQSGSVETQTFATGKASGGLRLQRRRSETSHDVCALASGAMGVHMELGVANPVPPLKAPTVSGQWQQAFWRCGEAGEKEVFGVERLTVVRSWCDDLNDPSCADPLLTDVLRRLFRSQRPGDVTTMTDLLIHCEKNGSGVSPRMAV
jgi:hypothetical protein